MNTETWIVKSTRVQDMVSSFTLSTRHWCNYPADRIEVILRHAGFIPNDAYYVEFNEKEETVIFGRNLFGDKYSYQEKLSWKDKFHQIIKILKS